MTYHVLNGDALVERFLAAGLSGKMVVARECLVEGDVTGDTLPQLFQNRFAYLSKAYKESSTHYFTEVVSEFEKLLAAPGKSEFNLWFGYDLFCRTNMWFVTWLLHSLPIEKKVFAVYPSYLKASDIWKDFGSATPQDLQFTYQQRIQFTDADLQLGSDLWLAFQSNNLPQLAALSGSETPAFPYLKEVCQAHIERFPQKGEKGRPERVVEEIMNNATPDFNTVFARFYEREGIYGFGDAQLKRMYDDIMSKR